jgi:hypothetical protein
MVAAAASRSARVTAPKGVVTVRTAVEACMKAFSGIAWGAAVLVLLINRDISQLRAEGNQSGPEPEVELFVGTAENCNAGIVTTDRNFRNCGTMPIGWSVKEGSAASDRRERLYVGVVADKNAGVVTTNPNHMNAATKPIGYATANKYGGRQLYVGTAPNCNEGEVAINNGHKGCNTREIGFTYQKR